MGLFTQGMDLTPLTGTREEGDGPAAAGHSRALGMCVTLRPSPPV